MIRINQIKMELGHTLEELEEKAAKILKVKKEEIQEFTIVKQSIDARKKPSVFYTYSVDVAVEKEEKVIKRVSNPQISHVAPTVYQFPADGKKKVTNPPVIIGSGPAGLFCAYMLAMHGYRPVLLERGDCVEEREKKVAAFWQTGKLDENSNVQFGEGGAGTFSDGKLNTLVKDKEGRNKEVLRIFTEAGASESIQYESKPHIGTDVLTRVVKNMREKIIEYGGTVLFNSQVTDFQTEKGRIAGLVINGTKKMNCEVVVLAIGHSARDTFDVLYQKKFLMEAKSFAVGLRVEHPQTLINQSQYGSDNQEELGAAPYKLTAQSANGRGVYSFCMCPGGYVVNASSEKGRLAVNGMSYQNRAGKNANSAIIVSVTPEDFKDNHALAGVAFQRELEEKAYQIGAGKVPVQLLGDFKQNRISKKEDLSYEPAVKGEYVMANVREILPKALNEAFLDGMEQFAHKIKGFCDEKTILSGIESRTSSPVRIHRDETMQSNILGLYPCGEGAGYAGGITSAAMDGIKVAEKIAMEFQTFLEL